MIKDVKNYFQVVASRLSNAFVIDSFTTEQELEFWSLAAEHVSREDIPSFRDIVQWVDLLFKAPVHFIYVRNKENKLILFRREVLTNNLQYLIASSKEDAQTKKQVYTEFEDRLSGIESKISFNESMESIGISSFTIGQCQHIPLFKDNRFWGIYCIGPYVRAPEAISPRISIIARILTRWLSELYDKEQDTGRQYSKQVQVDLGDLYAGSLNMEGISGLLINYLITETHVTAGVLVEFGKKGGEILCKINIPEELYKNMLQALSAYPEFSRVFNEQQDSLQKYGFQKVEEIEILNTTNKVYLFLFSDGSTRDELRIHEIRQRIEETLTSLLAFRDQNISFSDILLDTYYLMLRNREKEREKTFYHTPRVEAFCNQFSVIFGMDQTEQEQLFLTARLHDIGYIGLSHITNQRTIGMEIEHPMVGEMMVRALPVGNDVKKGIATHHEWVDGGGSPRGLKGEEIPWPGKIVGIFEFIVQFIETHYDDDSNTAEGWITQLTDDLINRADKQFDMVLIPTVIELVGSLGWDGCCKLGEKV